VAARLGYCGLDSRRAPLVGDEIRGCWEAPATLVAVEPSEGHTSSPAPARPAPAGVSLVETPEHRSFVELDAPEFIVPPPDERWSLWGDAET